MSDSNYAKGIVSLNQEKVNSRRSDDDEQHHRQVSSSPSKKTNDYYEYSSSIQRKSSSSSMRRSNSPEAPYLWKEEGSSSTVVQDNVARRSRSVTFSPSSPIKKKKHNSNKKAMSYFAVQKPWVQETIRRSGDDDDDNINKKENDPWPLTNNRGHDHAFDLDESIQPWERATLRGDSLEYSTLSDSQHSSMLTSDATFVQPIYAARKVEALPAPPSKDKEEEEAKEEIVFDEGQRDAARECRDDNGRPLTEVLSTELSPPVSPNRRKSLLSGSVYEPPTSLHDVCYNAQTPQDLFSYQDVLVPSGTSSSSPSRSKLKEISAAASQRDRKGRTPLHLVSENHAISNAICPTQDDASIPGLQPSRSASSDTSTAEKKQVTSFVLDTILAANPMAMKLQDGNGHIPFERALIEWIHIMHNVDSPKNRRWGLGSRRFSSYSKLSAPSRIQHMWHSTSNHVSSAISWAAGKSSLAFKSNSTGSMATTDNSSPKKTDDIEGGGRGVSDPVLGDTGGRLSDVPEEEKEIEDDASWALDHFPSQVQLTSHVKYAVGLLSTILDHLDEYVPTRSFRRRTAMGRRSNGSDCTRDSFDVAMDEFRDFCFTESADVIAADVVREIASIPYLIKTFLLLSDDEEREWVFSSTLLQRVVMCENSIGPWLTGMLQSSKKKVAERALEYLSYLSNTLQEYPYGWGAHRPKSSSNLLSQKEDAHEELHDKVSDLEGFIPSLLALDERKIEEAATTLVVRKVLDRMISKPFAVSIVLFDSIFLFLLILSFRAACRIFLTGGVNGALYWIYVANSCTFYFIIRELGKGITIMERTKQARTYFLSFWTLTDILSICFALSSTVAMRVQFKRDEIDYDNLNPLRGLLAATTGLLWLRVLSLLKSINSQLATFVLAIFQITRDIMWFLVILCVLVVSFAQMFYTVLVPPECATGDPYPGDSVCKTAEYYLKTYTILLGDFGNFERETFSTAFSVILIVVFSFMVVIVLLNVLIAIVSDSYEKCLIRSQSLFGRARVMLIAELISLQNLFRTDSRKDVPAPESIYSKWWYGTFGDHRWSRGTTVFFFLSGLVVFIWFVAETAGYFTGKRVGNYIFSLASIFVNVILFIGIVTLLSNNAKDKANGSRRVLNRRCNCIWTWYDDVIQNAVLRLLGSDKEKATKLLFRGSKAKEPADEWSGRVNYLQQEMTRLAAECMEESAKTVEQHVSDTESRLRSEVNAVEDNVDDFKTEILNELRNSEARLEEMMKHSLNQLLQALSEDDKLD